MDKQLRVELINSSIRNTIELLTIYGNNLNTPHKKAIRKIIIGFVYLLEHKNKKFAFPLFCGGGKSTCIRGFIMALDQLDLDYGIVVSANQVEALCELLKALLSDGVPREKIGLIHSKDSASIQSDNKEEASNKQFVLVTHNRIKQNNKLDRYFYYKDRNRDLVIWDESLLSGDSINISAEAIRKRINEAKINFEHRHIGTERERNYSLLINYLSSIEKKIKEAQSKADKDFQIFFDKTPSHLKSIEESIIKILDNEGQELIDLLDYINRDEHIRYIKEQNGSLIYFKQTLPDELDSIAVLDASHVLREITKSDKSIKEINLGCSKTYENLKINYFKNASGRQVTEGHAKKVRGNKLINEMMEIISTILINHPDEPIVIWTFKEKNGINIIDFLKNEIKKANPNIDLDRKSVEGYSMLNFQTYGNELGLNSLRHCKHSVFFGLIHLPNAALVTYLKGQARNMELDVHNDRLVYKASIAEQAHTLYQAISRGSSRETIDGKCLDHSVYFYCKNPKQIKGLLDSLFPKAQWNEYDVNHLDNATSKAYQLALKVDNKLSSLSGEEIRMICGTNSKSSNKVSTRKARQHLFTQIDDKDWKLITREFRCNDTLNWKVDNKSFVNRL